MGQQGRGVSCVRKGKVKDPRAGCGLGLALVAAFPYKRRKGRWAGGPGTCLGPVTAPAGDLAAGSFRPWLMLLSRAGLQGHNGRGRWRFTVQEYWAVLPQQWLLGKGCGYSRRCGAAAAISRGEEQVTLRCPGQRTASPSLTAHNPGGCRHLLL